MSYDLSRTSLTPLLKVQELYISGTFKNLKHLDEDGELEGFGLKALSVHYEICSSLSLVLFL